jgi:hypothetical protein
MIYDSIVIGNGLFGSLITRGLRELGRNVLLVGDNKEDAGSPPAACLMNPAWFKKLGSDVSEPAVSWLANRFNLHNLPFRETTQSGKVKATRSWFIEPSEMLLKPDLDQHVELVTRRGPQLHAILCCTEMGTELWHEARQVVVAAGVWSQRLVPWVDLGITGKAGVAWLLPEWAGPGFNFMDYWAPFKQIVGFQRGDGFWINDGSAILRQNWSAELERSCLQRTMGTFLKHRGTMAIVEPKRLFGIRPYTKVKPCYLEEVTDGLWVAVGAAKNGTLLGGYCARIIQERSK